MTVRSKTNKSHGSKLGFAAALAKLGDKNIYIAPKGTSADPFSIESWVLLGIVDGDGGEITPNIGKFEVITGSPRSRKAVIKTEQLDSMAVSFSHLTLAGLSLLKTGTTSSTFTAASDGQTAVATSGATDYFNTTVTAGTGLAVGDLCIVGNTIKEMVYITGVATADITHTLLSQLPADAVTFLKVDGTSAANSGVKFNLADGFNFSEFEVLVVSNYTDKQILLEHRLRGVPIAQGGIKTSPTAPASGSFTFDFLDSESDTILYGSDYLVPNES